MNWWRRWSRRCILPLLDSLNHLYESGHLIRRQAFENRFKPRQIGRTIAASAGMGSACWLPLRISTIGPVVIVTGSWVHVQWIQNEYCPVVSCGIIIVFGMLTKKYCQSAGGALAPELLWVVALVVVCLFLCQTKRFPKFCRVLPISTLSSRE